MDNKIKRLLAYYVKTLRIMRGYTQQEVADKLHKTTNAVSNWELGNTSPPVDDLVELCKMYNVTPSQILGWDDCPELKAYLSKSENAAQQIEELQKQKEEIEKQIQIFTEIVNRTK